jgi:Ca-activated chloride channel homolog
MKPSNQRGVLPSSGKWLLVLLASCLAIPGLPLRLAPISNGSTEVARRGQISVISELVLVPVNVTDSSGNFVPGLTRGDFRIYDSDREQRITTFQQEDSPVSVGVLVDHSGSMASKLPNVLTAISAFARASNPLDEMFVVNFGDEVTIALPNGKPFTSDAMEIRRAVSATSARGRTALYDAVAAGLSHLRPGHWEKKALIIISDGGDNASHLRYSQVLALARVSHVTIYSIGLVDEAGEEQNPSALEQLCKNTGGIAFFPRAADQVVDSSTSVARDLQEQYLLGFEPEQNGNDATFHKLQVRVAAPHRDKLRVRTRSGYTMSPPNAPPARSR